MISIVMLRIIFISILLILQFIYRDITISVSILFLLIIYTYVFNIYVARTYTKVVAVFSAIYLISSAILQLLVLHYVDLYAIAMTALDTLSLSLGFIIIITGLYRAIAKRALCNEGLRPLIISLKSIENMVPIVEEVIAINRVNYGLRKTPRNLIKFYTKIMMMISINIINNVIQYYESLLTTIPSIWKCRNS